MKPFSLVRATVITSFFAVSLSTASLIVQVYPYSLKESMNWISNFSKEYEENKPKFLAGINEIRNSHNMQDYVTIGGLLSKFLKDVHKLNATLVKGKIPDIDVSDDVDVTIRTLIDFIAAIKDMLDELLVRIKEWERNAKKVNEDTVILAVPGLPRWFKKYDLRISEMRCIGILDLKTLIENIVGANRPLEKLLSFFGTYIIEYQPIDLGQQLAWLRALSSFTDGMKYLGIYLKGDDEVSKASATEIMDALTWLGEDNQPLRNLIGNGEPGTLHSPMTKLYQRAHFIVKHLPKYWEILQVMSSTIQDELTKFEADLRSFSSIEMQRLFVEHGFVEGNTTYEAMALADKVKALIDDNGPITGLCLEVANYIKKGKPKNVETVASTAGNPAGTSAEAPAGTPAEAPAGTPAEAPTRTSAGNPARTSAEAPAGTPAEAPTRTSAGNPAGTPAEAPAGTPAEAPTRTSAEAPAGTPAEAPAGTPAEAPAGTPAEAPAGTPAEAPTRTSAGNPTRTSAGNPARTSAEAPAGTPAEAPTRTSAGNPARTSAEAPAGTPAGTPAEAPAGTPAEAPTRTSAEAPAGTPAEAPTRTSAGNPARTSAEAPAGTPAGTPAEAPATSTTIATYTEYPKYFREYTAEEPNDSDSNLEDNTAPHETSSYKESEEGNGEPLINTNAEDASIPPASTREKTPASDVHKKAPSKALTLKKGSCRKATSWLSHLSLGAIPIVCVLLFI